MSKSDSKQEDKKEKQAQGQGQLTYDPSNRDPFRKRSQLAVPDGERKKDAEK